MEEAKVGRAKREGRVCVNTASLLMHFTQLRLSATCDDNSVDVVATLMIFCFVRSMATSGKIAKRNVRSQTGLTTKTETRKEVR